MIELSLAIRTRKGEFMSHNFEKGQRSRCPESMVILTFLRFNAASLIKSNRCEKIFYSQATTAQESIVLTSDCILDCVERARL